MWTIFGFKCPYQSKNEKQVKRYDYRTFIKVTEYILALLAHQ